MKTIQLIEFLSTSSDLRDVLSDEEIIALVPFLDVETISAGSVIRSEGAPECSLLIVVSGEIRLSHNDTELNKLNSSPPLHFEFPQRATGRTTCNTVRVRRSPRREWWSFKVPG